MPFAAITGWGKCLPPAVLTNRDLATFLDTDDDWVVSRTGMRERRISHVSLGELVYVASARALACAGLAAEDLDLVLVGSTLGDEMVPNVASGAQKRLGARNAAAMDLNTACTSFLYGLSSANAMIRTGVIRNALVIGAEVPSPFMDWDDRNVAVLFGDGCGAAGRRRGC
jgi:3-oxoacyl-[acyl-carrier-protein] synthase-3